MSTGRSGDLTTEFLANDTFAVVGASSDRTKYGNKVLRAYLGAGMTATPINPRAETVEGLPAFPSLSDLPQVPDAVSIITPPTISVKVLEEGSHLGIKWFWLQPGAENDDCFELARNLGLQLIAGGPCILVSLRFRESEE